MATIKSTGNDQKLFLREDFDNQSISLLSLGGYTLYLPVNKETDFTDLAIRSAEALITTSAQSGKTFTVADGTLFRKDETVPVLDSGSEHKGAINIRSIDGNILTFEKVNGSIFDAASGDILLLRMDTKISEDAISVIETRRFQHLLVKTENPGVELVAEIMFTGVKKKF